MHGKYRRSESDRNGVYGTWWVGVPQLVATFGKEVVHDKLCAYEAAQKEARERAVRAAERAAERAERDGEEGGGEEDE